MGDCPATMMTFLFVISMGFLCSSNAHTIYVGGRDGWTIKPSENYGQWAKRYRFQINDTLVFKYKKGEDSVLVVNQDDYNKCNKKNPMQNFTDGDSKFKFEKSGPFYFISGHDQNCEKGEKLVTVVISDRHPSPKVQPPAQAPPSQPPSSHSPPPSGKAPPPAPVVPQSPPPPTSPPPKQSPPPSPKAPTSASPPPSTPPPAPVPHQSPSPTPEAESPDESYAPAPAPSAAPPKFGAPFVLLACVSLVMSTVVSVGLV